MKRPSAKSFEDLIVWQKAHRHVLSIYEPSKGFPKEEVYGLTSQLRRASSSVPANIAEGFKRRNTKDKIRFYNIAQSSLVEARYFLILAGDLQYGNTKELLIQNDEVGMLLHSFIKSLG